jgi:hypothetical protein
VPVAGNTTVQNQGMGELHRIYWQQWLSTSSSSTSSISASTSASPTPQDDALKNCHDKATVNALDERTIKKQPQLITSSAAVRIAPGNAAHAKDVTKLLRDTLNLTRINHGNKGSSGTGSGSGIGIGKDSLSSPSTGHVPLHDSLVLVGTLYSLPKDYVVFEHEVGDRNSVTGGIAGATTLTSPPLTSSSSISSSEPFHVVKTLQEADHPLQVRDKMVQHLQKVWERATKNSNKNRTDLDLNSATTSPTLSVPKKNMTPMMKTQWYFVPGAGSGGPSIIPSCIELDGYATDMDSDDDNNNDRSKNNRNYKVSCESDSDDDPEDKSTTPSSSGPSKTPRRSFLPSPLQDDYTGFPSFSSSLSSSSYWMSGHSHCSVHISDVVPVPYNKNCDKTANGKNDTDLRQYLQVAQSHTMNPNTLSGYLLKQSKNDPHVWKRVYCVLSEDYLWCIHRCGNTLNDSIDDNAESSFTRLSSKRRRIRLSRAILLEPTIDFIASQSINRIPHAFSVINGKGYVHVFRASSRWQAYHWTRAISLRLVEAMETSSLLQSAELIVTDENVARTTRWKSLAIEPFLVHQWMQSNTTVARNNAVTNVSINDKEDDKEDDRDVSMVGILTPKSTQRTTRVETPLIVLPFTKQVIRLGMAVAQYREACRHIQSLLWSQVGSTTPSLRSSTTGSGALDVSSLGEKSDIKRDSTINNKNQSFPNDGSRGTTSKTSQMVQDAWKEASELLVMATQVAMQVQITGRPASSSLENNNKNSGNSSTVYSNIRTTTTKHHHSSRSLETLCRHVDYIITGQLHRSSGSNSNSVSTSSVGGNGSLRTVTSRHDHHRDPPPMDLFDSLLAELQSISRDQTDMN